MSILKFYILEKIYHKRSMNFIELTLLLFNLWFIIIL